MQQFVGRVLTAFAFFVALVLSPSANAASITIAPDSLFGYIPLSAFGVTPTPIGDDDIVNFNVPDFQWAGQTWNRIGVVSNGYVVVGGGSSADVNLIPSAFPKRGCAKQCPRPVLDRP